MAVIMTSVFIAGVSSTPVRRHTETTVDQLGSQVIKQLIEETSIDPRDIGAIYVGNMLSGMLSQQQMLAPLIANESQLHCVEAITAESACGSGAAAVRLGHMAIASGTYEAVIVCGAEQMSHCKNAEVTQALASASHWKTEGSQGESFLSLNALLMQSYMNRFHVNATEFSHFSINAHANACSNPNAMLQKPIDQQKYTRSKYIVKPVRLYDAPPICDGAAALLLCNERIAQSLINTAHPVVKIIASTSAVDHLSLNKRDSLSELTAARHSTTAAYRQADVTPEDIDVFELHDAYSIIAALSLEAAGFADKGCGTQLGKDGEIGLDGKIPISTFGGLKARGHPVGATGIYQIAECFSQLTGTAGKNQVQNAHIAMAQNFGGAGSSVFTHILTSL